jgi:hypothetical protein
VLEDHLNLQGKNGKNMMRLSTVFGLFVAVTTPAWAEQAATALSPGVAEASDAKSRGVPVAAKEWMIAAANPLAAEAGATVLRNGGTAADAMITVQAVLGLVHSSSGMMLRQATSSRLTAEKPLRWRSIRNCSWMRKASH